MYNFSFQVVIGTLCDSYKVELNLQQKSEVKNGREVWWKKMSNSSAFKPFKEIIEVYKAYNGPKKLEFFQ